MVSRVEKDEGVVRREELDILAQRDCYIPWQHTWQLQSVLGEPASDDTGTHTTDDFVAFLKTKLILSVRLP